ARAGSARAGGGGPRRRGGGRGRRTPAPRRPPLARPPPGGAGRPGARRPGPPAGRRAAARAVATRPGRLTAGAALPRRRPRLAEAVLLGGDDDLAGDEREGALDHHREGALAGLRLPEDRGRGEGADRDDVDHGSPRLVDAERRELEPGEEASLAAAGVEADGV